MLSTTPSVNKGVNLLGVENELSVLQGVNKGLVSIIFTFGVVKWLQGINLISSSLELNSALNSTELVELANCILDCGTLDCWEGYLLVGSRCYGMVVEEVVNLDSNPLIFWLDTLTL